MRTIWTRCLLALSICSLFVGMGWSADDKDKDKDQSDITKRIDASARVSGRNHGHAGQGNSR